MEADMMHKLPDLLSVENGILGMYTIPEAFQ